MKRFFYLFLFVFVGQANAAKMVTFYGVGPDTYEIVILKKALQLSSDEPVELRVFDGLIPKQRAFQIMEKGEGIDIVVAGATKARAELGQPVHFPLFKGLFGLRVSLVNKDRQDLLQDVQSLDGLRAFTAGQFHTWTDTRVLQHNGITVASGSDESGLYHMLDKNRYDFFPRSILEVSWNLQGHSQLNLAIDPHTIIHYPKAHYFYVKPGNDELAVQIKSGLESLHESGELDALFDQTFGETLAQFELGKRQWIKMENPDLPDGVPINRK